MQLKLELLAPAKNRDIGIAAITCGADAVYIAGPSFGAREAAGNSLSEIAELVEFAHKFGGRLVRLQAGRMGLKGRFLPCAAQAGGGLCRRRVF